MSTRSVTFAADETYHVFNRGNNKSAIFKLPSDYERFLQLLYLANTSTSFNVRNVLQQHDSVFSIPRPDTLIRIHAACLMPNHFHLLVTPLSDHGLSTFMLKLGTSYSMYFNKRHDRTGALFEGRFKARHIDDDRYQKYIFTYIHLNPVRSMTSDKSQLHITNMLEQARAYPYSSLNHHLSLNNTLPRAALGRSRDETDGAVPEIPWQSILSTELFEDYFSDPVSATEELLDWLSYDEDFPLGQP